MRNQNDGWAAGNVALLLAMFALSWLPDCSGEPPEAKAPPPEVKDHRVEVKIDKQITIVSRDAGLRRAMMSMVCHPDGSIYLNTQTQETLYRSTDNGQTWTPLPVNFTGELKKQALHALIASRDGRLWLMHQSAGGKDLFVSYSSDQGKSWTTTSIDYANLAPGAPEAPYLTSYNDYNSFIERPDGTMMLGVGLRYYEEPCDYAADYAQEDQSRAGFHETLIRSSGGGKNWGDPTKVHQHVAETCYAVDPNDHDHILAMTRKQRMMLPGETKESLQKDLGEPPPNLDWPYKGAILLESTNGGRSFREVLGSYLGHYSHRGTMLWTKTNVIVAPHTAPGPDNRRLVVNVSLDGGKTWVDGTKAGAQTMKQARNFVLVPGFYFTTPTVELSQNHFLTAYCHKPGRTVSGLFWHIERTTEK